MVVFGVGFVAVFLHGFVVFGGLVLWVACSWTLGLGWVSLALGF